MADWSLLYRHHDFALANHAKMKSFNIGELENSGFSTTKLRTRVSTSKDNLNYTSLHLLEKIL
jgi:hypothetical protein